MSGDEGKRTAEGHTGKKEKVYLQEGRVVRVRRILEDNVVGKATAWRYQTAFVHEKYAAVRAEWLATKAAHDEMEQRYLRELGYGFLVQQGLKEAASFTLDVPALRQLLHLGSLYRGAALWGPTGCAMEHPDWSALIQCFQQQCGSGDARGFDLASGQGCFLRIEETSAKDFECYHDAAAGGPFQRTAIYARAGDIPWAQRRAFAAEIAASAPSLPAKAALPPLTYLRGQGPYTNWHTVVAALVVDEKCQLYAGHHVDADRPLSLYLSPWDTRMDTARELRVYVKCGVAVAIGSWHPEAVFPWLDQDLTDEDLATLAREVADYTEREVVPVVSRAPAFAGDCTFAVDVLVLPRAASEAGGSERWQLAVVELGGYGKHHATGSTLFHWLEDDVFESAADATPVCEIRVLTADPARGERLSVLKPVPRPDL
ncbi:hypothetical protein DIPPA_16934 [Diplonema papillatum]|nr:hypothetical protein DIPPA_16934 [Diplonema papillatum]|eukprot:gene7834-12041_t